MHFPYTMPNFVGTPEPVTAVQLPSKKSLAVVEPSSDLDVVKIFKDLKSIPNMEKFLNENPQLKKDFLKHLSLAKVSQCQTGIR